jgi:hypothetical protein
MLQKLMWRQIGKKLVDFMKSYKYLDGTRLFEYLDERDNLQFRFGTGNTGEYPAIWVIFSEEDSVEKQDKIIGGKVQFWIDVYLQGKNTNDIPISEYLYNQSYKVENELLKVLHDDFSKKIQRELGIGVKFDILAVLSDGDETMALGNTQHRIVIEIEWYKSKK